MEKKINSKLNVLLTLVILCITYYLYKRYYQLPSYFKNFKENIARGAAKIQEQAEKMRLVNDLRDFPLRKNDYGEYVCHIQHELNGIISEDESGYPQYIEVTGIFDDATEKALLQYCKIAEVTLEDCDWWFGLPE